MLFMPSFILCFYVLACLSTLTVSICIGVVGSGMLAYYALAEARAVGYLFFFSLFLLRFLLSSFESCLGASSRVSVFFPPFSSSFVFSRVLCRGLWRGGKVFFILKNEFFIAGGRGCRGLWRIVKSLGQKGICSQRCFFQYTLTFCSKYTRALTFEDVEIFREKKLLGEGVAWEFRH